MWSGSAFTWLSIGCSWLLPNFFTFIQAELGTNGMNLFPPEPRQDLEALV